VIDLFDERIITIISELEGRDIRKQHRFKEIKKLVTLNLSEIDNAGIITIITEELYSLIYES